MDSNPVENHELKMAREFVVMTDRHLYLTGKAGTGKTTFLKELKKNTSKRMIITAPTGVAAINAGGVTLHSFFQLPFGPFVPGSDAYAKNKTRMFRFSREKRQIIQNLDLLVIDEISMVRADLLDAVDAALQYHRRNTEPFGGVQLLLIGDLFQLPPVAKQDEWALLREHFDSIYFFSSQALRRVELLTIELQYIYRQSDSEFIKLLNRVRDNRLDRSLLDKLNQRCTKEFNHEKAKGFITLTTHNRSADAINEKRLAEIQGKAHAINAEISGDFPDQIYPTFANLTLKKGAQVMFLRNDASGNGRYYNGKIGKISSISRQKIFITCTGETDEIAVEPVEWKNIKYTLNEKKMEIEEDVIGTFKQFPLKLAWAITIHKSQGLTFDNVMIDASAAFAHGQVYVALSRCKTFEGMVLSSPLSARGIETDSAIIRFVTNARKMQPTEKVLGAAKKTFQEKLLLSCFELKVLRSHLKYLAGILRQHASLIQVSGISGMNEILDTSEKNIFTVSEKFKRQLQAKLSDQSLPESNAIIHERVGKAYGWFKDQFSLVFDDLVNKLHVETDNKELEKKFQTALLNLRKEIFVKLSGITACKDGFSTTRYLRALSKAEMDFTFQKKKKSQEPGLMESDVEHPELFQWLKDWRSGVAEEKDVARFQILHQKVLIQIAIFLPDSKKELKKIKGVGKRTIENYGEALLKMVIAYRKKHKIPDLYVPKIIIHPTKNPSLKKALLSDTKQISFDMFKKGLTIEAIAEERELVISTIQGHLCFFIENGDLAIQALVAPEKQQAIEKVVSQVKSNSLTDVKNKLGDDYSYGEIKMVGAHQKSLKKNSKEDEQ